MTKTLSYTNLPNRSAIIISGSDRFSFLQGLVTNNVEMVKDGRLVYSCLLSPQGKFLFDFFIREENDAVILDCEGGERAEALLKKLRLYKLHAEVMLTLEPENVYAAWDGVCDGYKDPRHPDLGYRLYKAPQEGQEAPFEEWDLQRIKLCIPDGSRDMVVERSTMLESRIDKLGGIDFKKGCYIGQELTARMHYRGLAKKHLYAVEFKDTPPAPFTEIEADGKGIGEMRSSQDHWGIALLKDEILSQEQLPFKIA